MKIEVLDHGYVEFIEAWGTGHSGRDNVIGYPHDYEVGIIEAARQSTQGSFRGWEPATCTCDHTIREEEANRRLQKLQGVNTMFVEPVTVAHREECASVRQPGDARLLSYLYRNKHSTPFEFAGMVLEVQAPIFVFREWHRHRTQSYNEASARYAPLPDLNYVPDVGRLLKSGDNGNRQSSSTGKVLSEAGADAFALRLKMIYHEAQQLYQNALDIGVPKELARLVLPVGRYSKMRASANLRNWLAFMTLRCDPAAQWEIQQYANAVAKIIQEKFPQTYALWAGERENEG